MNLCIVQFFVNCYIHLTNPAFTYTTLYKNHINLGAFPVFDNLDDTVSLPNTQAGGSTLFTLAFSDADTEDTLTVTQTATTGSAAAFFEYDGTTCMC